MSKELAGNAQLILSNRTKNIIRIDGHVDTAGAPLVLGIESDRGVVGAPQPEVKITAAEYKKMSENRAIQGMLDGRMIDVRRPFDI